jgi:hypothetical protein
MNLSILVHTFSGYSFLWDGFVKSFDKNWGLRYPETFIGSDIPCENDHFFQNHPYLKMKYSGSGEWADRLTKLLIQIPSDYILYMQDDHYPKMAPDLNKMVELVEKHGLLRLQISPIVQFYSLYGSGFPLFFHETSKYLVSHQPSIWKKSFLLECLKPNETPWQNEYAGTMRLNVRKDLRGKIAIYPCDWYKHMCIRGKLVET